MPSETFVVSDGTFMSDAHRTGGKPGSVSDSHSSRHTVAGMLKQPTRTLGGQRHCVLFGLAPNGVWPAAYCYQMRGAPLPHLFTLTCFARRQSSAVLLSVPLSVALPRPAVNRHSTLRSPDFPPRMPYAIRGDCLPVPCAARIITRNAKMPSETVQVSDGIQPKLHALFQAGFDEAVQIAVQYGFGVADFVTCA